MNTNTICLRIFFVLFLIVVGAITVFCYGAKALTPLAVCVLPTERTEARFTSNYSTVEYRLDSTSQLFHTDIAYAGNTATLVTTSPPTQPDHPGLQVRFVHAFPSMVVRDLPNSSLWSYYADTWTGREFASFFAAILAVGVVTYCFYRHIRNSRRRGYRR